MYIITTSSGQCEDQTNNLCTILSKIHLGIIQCILSIMIMALSSGFAKGTEYWQSWVENFCHMLRPFCIRNRLSYRSLISCLSPPVSLEPYIFSGSGSSCQAPSGISTHPGLSMKANMIILETFWYLWGPFIIIHLFNIHLIFCKLLVGTTSFQMKSPPRTVLYFSPCFHHDPYQNWQLF